MVELLATRAAYLTDKTPLPEQAETLWPEGPERAIQRAAETHLLRQCDDMTRREAFSKYVGESEE